MSSPPPGHSLREARHAADAHQRQLEAAHPRDPDLTDSNQITERMNRRPREPEVQVSKPGRAVSPALAVVVRGRRAAPRGVAAAACEVVESSARWVALSQSFLRNRFKFPLPVSHKFPPPKRVRFPVKSAIFQRNGSSFRRKSPNSPEKRQVSFLKTGQVSKKGC